MDEFERSEAAQEQQVKKRTHSRLFRLLGRVAALLVTAALALGAIYLVSHRDSVNVDSLRRLISYRSSASEEGGLASQFSYSGDAANSFALLNGGVLTCSVNQLQLLDKTGEKVIEQTVQMAQPILCAEGSYAVAYDAGGTELYLIHGQEVTHTYSPAKGQGLLSARVNADGWLTVVEQATGYKASVTVYDPEFQPVVTENISSTFVTDAILSPDEDLLALVTLGEDTTGFDCVVIFYNVSDGQERYRCVLGNDVVLDLDWEKDALWVAGEYGAYCIQDGVLSANCLDKTRFLQHFSLGGKGFAALFFSKYQGGSTGALTILSADGSQSSIGVNEEVLSVSAAGGYLAVLTGSELTIYQSDLSVYAVTENSEGARRVLMREDGSALLISTGSVTAFLPA